METKMHNTSDGNSSVFLTGAILLANLDYSGLAEYAIKAAIGGIIWMGFKLTSDYVSDRVKKKKENE
jgi:hypothetical protein